ncbi:hypothetical protein GBA52_002146 [Prunus armeniaca]|nr:hypothetical protein GBA52_002146 [Prunus armeniaca]
MAQREGQVVVKIDNCGASCSKETTQINGEASPTTTTVGGSPEKPTESFRRRSKELPLTDAPSNSGGAEVLRCSSNASFSRNSWKPPMSKTKSRLLDPPEESCLKSDRVAGSGRALGKNDDNALDDADIEDIPEEYKRIKFSALTLLQWVSLVFVIAALVCNLWIPIIKRQTLWDLPLWKWELLVLALICGRLVSGWGIRVVVFFVERNFLLRKRVLYFVYGLRKSVQNCLWLGLVLVVWHFIFDKKVEEKTQSRILPYVTKVLICFLVGTLIWLLKTILVKVLALSFHVNAFFERIQEALFNQYVIETLSGPPLFERKHTEEEEKVAAEIREFQNAGATMPRELRASLLQRARSGRVIGSGRQNSPRVGKSPRVSRPTSGSQDEEIPVDHLQKLNQKNVSAWNMRRMVNIIRHGSLTTLDEQILNSDIEDDSSLEIKTECQAKDAAKKIFLKVAKPGSSYIYLEDLMPFMHKDEALKTIHLFGAANESDRISKSALRDWVVSAFRERRALALSLNDTKTAVDELHNILNIIVAVIIVIIWLIILGIPVTHFLLLISSQLLLVVFIFGNTCKTVFEAIIFLFVMHPFDVGDRCEVEGVQMVVEEMNILTTVFLKFDHQKIIYPNSILATKPIANYHRSPDMGDAVDFCVHISTPLEKLAIMKERIQGYIESRSDHWYTAPMLIMRDVEDLNKLKISVWPTHKMNHQDMLGRWTRRSLLIEAMIQVFRELDIEYRLLPLDVNVRNMPSLTSNKLPSNWTTCVPPVLPAN